MGFATSVFPCLGLAALLVAAARLPGEEPAGPRLRDKPFQVTAEDRSWWAFQPVRSPGLPRPGNPAWVTGPIDAFILAQLEQASLAPNPPATRRELIRRAAFDLLGLPPAPEEVEAFENDPSPLAWERLVDDLLSRPQYGERWARHWLDLVRYGESNGYERDGTKPHAWRYRDYVIQSFNADKPYDRFVTEQLAGDELPEGFNADAVVATGFYRLHVWDDEPDSALAADFDDLDDIMVTTSAAFLGLTVGCARCHDHKFDPLSQADYYQLLAYFRSINPYGVPHRGGGGRGTGRITRLLASPAALREWETAREGRLQPLRARLAATTDAAARKDLEARVKAVETAPPPFPAALAVAEDPVKPTHVLRRGDVQNPGAEVDPGVPACLGTATPSITPPAGGGSSGQRQASTRRSAPGRRVDAWRWPGGSRTRRTR